MTHPFCDEWRFDFLSFRRRLRKSTQYIVQMVNIRNQQNIQFDQTSQQYKTYHYRYGNDTYLIRNTYLKYIYVFCIWNTFWKCILYLYFKYILMHLYFNFKAKNTKYILMRKYDVIALISKHILSCLSWFLPVLPIWTCAGSDCTITTLTA